MQKNPPNTKDMGSGNKILKKEYAKPSLIRRGTVSTLTKGSAGSNTDGFGGNKASKGG